jgi:hypothetical protein
MKKVPEGVNMVPLSPLDDFKDKKIVFKKMSRFDGSLWAQVTRPEVKAYFVSKGYHVADVKFASPIKTVGEHQVTVDDFPITIRVVGFH